LTDSKIVEIVATMQLSDFKAKCTKFDFGWDFAPYPAGGAHSIPHTLAGLKGRASKGKEGGEGRKGKEVKGCGNLASS